MAAGPIPAPSLPGLTCRVFGSFAGLDHLRTSWDEACLRAGASVYMTYDWARVWWEFYGKDSELRLFIFFAGQEIEAVVPMYITTLGWGMLRLRVGRIVGANIPPKVFDPPVPESCSSEVMGHIVDQLFRQECCDLLSFGPVSELHSVVKCMEAICSQRTSLVLKPSVVTGVHTTFHVPATMEQYFSSLSKNERKNRRKDELRLRTEYQTHVDVVSDAAEVSQEFENFAVQHRQQWAAKGKSGHFGAWPRALDYNRALVKAQGERGRLRFTRILANGKVIANLYTFAFGDRYFCELSSREVDPKWEHFGLGAMASVIIIEQAIREGMSRVEDGLGHYDYKLSLGAKEYKTLTFRIVAAEPIARARFALFSVVRACWSCLYHKLWYRRLMSRLPGAFWKPQSEQWLRVNA